MRLLVTVLLLVVGFCHSDPVPNVTVSGGDGASAKAATSRKGAGTPSVPGSYIKKGTPGHMASTFFTRNAKMIRRAKLELLRTVFATAIFFILSLVAYSCVCVLGLDNYAQNQVVVSTLYVVVGEWLHCCFLISLPLFVYLFDCTFQPK
jgi:hypothetical protein